jgi:glycosyltransferase involved in cell wall biosynthesis
MTDNTETIPWVSFCMSTYQRPDFLQKQLQNIALQTFGNFEVIISDNDPSQSAKPIVAALLDSRFKYFSNGENLGMIASFNKSIERANADFIVMITDDDPVNEQFLSEMHEMYQRDSSFSLYAGFIRSSLKNDELEIIVGDDFAKEILDLNKTPWILWSSCIMKKSVVVEVGKMPDYGSPHFADHALIAMVGSRSGGMIKNKMFSTLSSHDGNFSKSNFHYYVLGCEGFYNLMERFSKGRKNEAEEKKAVIIHLGKWFFGCIFTLKKYFYITNNVSQHDAIVTCAREILTLPYMQRFKPKYYAKSVIFEVKKKLLFKKSA